MAIGDAPVLDALLEINATALNRSELDPVTMLLVNTISSAERHFTAPTEGPVPELG